MTKGRKDMKQTMIAAALAAGLGTGAMADS